MTYLDKPMLITQADLQAQIISIWNRSMVFVNYDSRCVTIHVPWQLSPNTELEWISRTALGTHFRFWKLPWWKCWFSKHQWKDE